MIKVNINEAKTHLSEYLERVEAGEVVVVCRRNVPIAEIRPLPQRSPVRRQPGVGRAMYGEWSLADSFFDPLPDEIVDAFEGSS